MIKFLTRTGILLALLFVAFGQETRATHLAGGDFNITSLGGNQYYICLTLFRDCSGVNLGTFNQTITITSNDVGCGNGQSFTVSLPWQGTTEVSQLCASQIVNSTCNNGQLPGMQQFVYCDTVFFGPPLTNTPNCNDWQVAWTSCCRNFANVNLVNPGSQSFVIRADINTKDFPNNNTPIFTAQPIPYVCINRTVNYNFGVVEPDGDSLAFALVAALTTPAPQGTPLAYAAPFSPSSPITGITLDPLTGQLVFTPTQFGNFTIVLQVCEYDVTTGKQKSCVFRDIQVIVQNCAGAPPQSAAGGIQSFTGTGSQVDSNSAAVCVGQNFSFTLIFNDSNVNDILSVTSNISSILPGAVFNTNGTNPVTATVTWTGAIVNGGSFFTFNVFVVDDACPQTNIAFFTYDVTLTAPLDLGQDFMHCEDDTTNLQANVGDSICVSVLSGDSLIPGVNIECVQCGSNLSPWIHPDTTTTYVVFNYLDSACKPRDTITVIVFDTFNVQVTPIGPLCVTDFPEVMSSVTPGGFWYGLGVDTLTGTFDPSVVNTPLGGCDTIQVIYDLQGSCPNMDTLDVIVKGQPNTTITSTGPFCGQENNIQLTSQVPGGFWTGPISVDSSGILNGLLVNAPDTIMIKYTIIDSFCENMDTLFAEVIDIINSGFDSLPQICLGDGELVFLDSIVATPGGTWTGDSIQPGNIFDPSSLPAGIYPITYSFGGACGSVTSDTLVVHALPDVEIIADDTTFCETNMDTLSFSAGINGVWGGNAVTSASGEFIPSQLGAGTYLVTHEFFDPVTRCFNHDSIHVEIGQQPATPNILTSQICSGTSIDILAAGLQSNDFTWYVDGTQDSVLFLGNPLPLDTVNNAVWLFVTQTSPLGCESPLDSILLSPLPSPVASFTPSPDMGSAPLPVNFTNTSSPSTGVTYTWDFGDGATSSQVNPNHTYNQLGIYSVTLFATNGVCNSAASGVITVEGIVFVNIPNVFTPNGDGVNDAFRLEIGGVDDYNFVIYNRWGKKVFESTNPAEAWSGEDFADGTYYYVMTGKEQTLSRNDIKRTGNITLLRQGK